jgi:hypothetical protein
MIGLKILFTLLIAAVGAVLYRLGGAAKTGKWYDFLCQTKTRDFGVPLCCLGALWIWDGFVLSSWWGYLLSFGATFGAMTTYWKKKGTDAKWWNWMLVGLGISLGFLPYAVSSSDWLGFLLRSGVLTLTITISSTLIGNAVVEELVRGFLAVVTVALMAIGLKKKK